MKPEAQEFIKLLFNTNETICVSHNKFAYHSIKQEELNKSITMISPNCNINPEFIKEENIDRVSINPINGFRNDQNVTIYRTFLIEIDEGLLNDQLKYIKELEMPYSVCVFSGNKSLHFGIVLDKPLSCEHLWRSVNEWILNIVTKADQACKNPSRCIRFPGHIRKDGRGLEQKLIELKTRVSQEELTIWLNKFWDKRPKPLFKPKNTRYVPLNVYTFPKWIQKELENGIYENRNNRWFKIGLYLAEHVVFTEEESIDYLEKYFEEQPNFKYSEWKATILSAFKYSEKNRI